MALLFLCEYSTQRPLRETLLRRRPPQSSKGGNRLSRVGYYFLIPYLIFLVLYFNYATSPAGDIAKKMKINDRLPRK